jgi:predicted nucleic acid-binding protein
MTVSVLDSWAMLGWLQAEEPARATVREMLELASRGEAMVSMSLINVGEVFYLVAKRHGSAMAERFLSEIPMMPLRTLLPDRKLILNAARLKSRFAISYADAFAVETARQEKALLVTGDPELFDLSRREPVEVLWVGAKQPR